jgi:hypothetical protein
MSIFKIEIRKVLGVICGIMFMWLQNSAISQSYEFDIVGEWRFPTGISGAAARIRFNPTGETLVSHLEIAGLGRSNDFTLVGSYINNSSQLCGDNQFISLCADLAVSSNTSGTLTVQKCEKLPASESGCSVSVGDILLIERAVRLSLSGIWFVGDDEYFLVTHASDGTINADPVAVSGGTIVEGVSYQGDVSITTGAGQVTGTDYTDGWTKEIQIISATDSSFTYQTNKCTGNCDDELDEIGLVRTAQRVDSRPGYSH